MDDGECDSQKENQNTNNNNKGEGGSKSRSKPSKKSTGERPQSPRSPVEWGFTDMCPSPTEDLPHVMSISSAEDHQQAWSGSKEDTMTSLLIEIIEELNHREVTTQELTRLLNGRMQRIRRQTMEAYYEGRKGSIMAEGTVKILNKIQLPQLGGLRKDVSRFIIEVIEN
ncbi:hypothetical protein BDY19DRAFT_750278 [Irpex rosettiformis]|uniref:Uncharacterized protein n=1 Tax=Irpex rosettiformis TaxID=378272 RepID=A0ACB8U6U5_9APHY|nr:hypothetical protein BDY19DRAFT_750278 [Irpex rosettiformis]